MFSSSKIKDFFFLPTRQRRALLIGWLVIITIFITKKGITWYTSTPLSVEKLELIQLALEDSLNTKKERKREQKNKISDSYRKNNPLKKQYDNRDKLEYYSSKKNDPLNGAKQYHSNIYKKSKLQISVAINSADSISLQALKGIGPVFAKRIIKYRNLLGGFVHPNQLLEIYGIDSLLLDQIKDNIIFDTLTIRKICLNNASIKELAQHPYIDFTTAKVITNYRRHHGLYKNIADLLKTDLVNEDILAKIAPYLTVDSCLQKDLPIRLE